MISTPSSALLRRGAQAVAAGRVALGLTALACPSVPARPWVGASADDLAAQVFGRALGARDLALGLGALQALRPAAEPGPAAAWLAAGALSDALDVAASLASWRQLPSPAGGWSPHPPAARRWPARRERWPCGASRAACPAEAARPGPSGERRITGGPRSAG